MEEIRMEILNKFLVIDEKCIQELDCEYPYGIVEPLIPNRIWGRPEEYSEELARLTIPQQFVFAIHWYDIEVCNGGHKQLYFNSTGIVWEETLKGLKAIGATKNYDILKESAKRLGSNPSKDYAVRRKQLDELGCKLYSEFNEKTDMRSKMKLWNKTFNDLDNAYYESKAELFKLLCKYIKANAKEFYFPAEGEKKA
jgi:hypothetical protein